MDVGWVTTACLKDILVHHLATPRPLLIVLLQKLDVTWAWMEPVGGETTAGLKDQFVLLSATHQLVHSAIPLM